MLFFPIACSFVPCRLLSRCLHAIARCFLYIILIVKSDAFFTDTIGHNGHRYNLELKADCSLSEVSMKVCSKSPFCVICVP